MEFNEADDVIAIQVHECKAEHITLVLRSIAQDVHNCGERVEVDQAIAVMVND